MGRRAYDTLGTRHSEHAAPLAHGLLSRGTLGPRHPRNTALLPRGPLGHGCHATPHGGSDPRFSPGTAPLSTSARWSPIDPSSKIRSSSDAGFISLSSHYGPSRIFIGGGIPAYISRSPSGSSAKTWHCLTARSRTTFLYFWSGCSSHGNSACGNSINIRAASYSTSRQRPHAPNRSAYTRSHPYCSGHRSSSIRPSRTSSGGLSPGGQCASAGF